MGIAEDMAREQLHMLPHLAFGIEPSTGIIQVDLLLGIQASVLRGAESIKGLRGIKGWILLPECSQSSFSGDKWCCVCMRHESAPSGGRVLQHMLRQEFSTCSPGPDIHQAKGHGNTLQ